MSNTNSQLPNDCYKKAQLPAAIGMGYPKFYKLSEQPSFPEPDGYYIGLPPAAKRLPYWHIDTIKSWLVSLDVTLTAKREKKCGAHMENKMPWEVPTMSKEESDNCFKTRKALDLMRITT